MKRWNRSILGWSLVLSMVAAGAACGSDADKDEHDGHPEGKMDAGTTGREPGGKGDDEDENEAKPGDAGKGTGNAKTDGGNKLPDAGRGTSPTLDAGVAPPRDVDPTNTEDAGETDPSMTPGPNPEIPPGPLSCDTTRCKQALDEAKKNPLLAPLTETASVCCIDANTCGGTFEGADRCYTEKEVTDGLTSFLGPQGPQVRP